MRTRSPKRPRRSRRRRISVWEATTRHLLSELAYRGFTAAGHAAGKIVGIAIVGGVANLVVHQFTDSHLLNAGAMLVVTGAAAAVKTRA